MSIAHKFLKQTASAALVLAAAAMLASCAQRAETASDPAALAAEVAELKSKVAYLSDRQEINDVYLRYMRGFDRNDVELLKSAFWPDVQINYRSQSNTLDEFIVRHLNQHTSQLASWGHLITNKSVDIDGDVAHVEAYVTAFWSHKDDKSKFANGATIVSGRYIDRLDRRNGEWRIAVREFIGHFSAKTDSVSNFAKTSDCTMGTWDRRDTSYKRPLTARVNKEIGPPCAE